MRGRAQAFDAVESTETASRNLRTRRRLSWWQLTGVVILAGITAVVGIVISWFLWVLLPALWVTIDETGLPSASHATDGLVVVSDEMDCASGGCWRTVTVVPPEGQSPQELMAVWDVEAGCAAQSWIDRRRVCTGVHARGAEVEVSLQYDRIQ